MGSTSVYSLATETKRDGAASIKLKRRGTKPGERRTLTADQEDELQRMLIDKTPDQLKMSFCIDSDGM